KFCMEKPADINQLDGLRLYLSQIAEINSIAIPEIHEKIVESVDWQAEYRKSIKAVEISPELLVRPPWAKSEARYQYEIVIEPKMAFGTGFDESTANCLRLMQKYFVSGQRFLEFGCGSGILSVFADRLSASYIKAIDNDPVAIDCCLENFELNSVTVRHDILCGSIGEIKPEEKFDMICANIAKEPILEFLISLIEHTAVSGYLVLSGICLNELEEIETALKQAKVETVDFIQGKMWLTYCIRK
ncbi:MAG: 50S ribosomal protein L11 methyltransferase, partial [candidate division Zixibacteria bacterium]